MTRARKGTQVTGDIQDFKHKFKLRPTWECEPPQPARTSPPTASPSAGPNGPACGGRTEPRDCPRATISECDGTSPSDVRRPPLQTPGPELGPGAWLWDRRNPAGTPPERPPGASLRWRSSSPCLKAGAPAPPTRSSLWRNESPMNKTSRNPETQFKLPSVNKRDGFENYIL